VLLDVKASMTDADVVDKFLEDKDIGDVFKDNVSAYAGGVIRRWQEEIGSEL